MPLLDCDPADFIQLDSTMTVDDIVLSGVTLTQGGGVQAAAIRATWVSGDVASSYIVALEFEFQGESLSTGVITKAVSKFALVLDVTDGIIAGKTYAVRYRAIGNNRFGPWSTPEDILAPATSVAGSVVDQGDLATEDEVDSDHLGVGAAVRITADQDIGGSVVIPSRGSPSGHVLIKSMNFTVDRVDSKFTVQISFLYVSNNSNETYCWIKIGQTAPVWAGSGSADMTNADKFMKVAAYNGPATAVFTFSGLPLGTNTLEIHGGSTGSGSHTNTAEETYFCVTEDKRPA